MAGQGQVSRPVHIARQTEHTAAGTSSLSFEGDSRDMFHRREADPSVGTTATLMSGACRGKLGGGGVPHEAPQVQLQMYMHTKKHLHLSGSI